MWAYRPRVKVVGYPRNVEGLTAGMARISRDPTPIPQLIREARENTALARARNERIVYEYGHNSVAEHGTFSVAIWDIPRHLSLEVVSHRLASYTQQSARYIPLEKVPRKFFIPQEYRAENAHRLYTRALLEILGIYEHIYQKLTAHIMGQDPSVKDEMAKRRATEDARYVLPLAQTTQLGVTANAREWALIICRLLSSDLSEARDLGHALFDALHPLAPSLFPEKYIHALPYPAQALEALAREAAQLPQETVPSEPAVALVHVHPADQRSIAALLLYRVTGRPFMELEAATTSMDAEQSRTIIWKAFTGLQAHDTVLREFENVIYSFELVMSEAAYHQFVRHRMTTQIRKPHTVELGPVIPPEIDRAGLRDAYLQGIELLESTYQKFGGDRRAELLVANGHKVRVLVQLNARELIEMSRVRMEATAQWEIRQTVAEMVRQVERHHPAVAMACGGRSDFKAGLLPIHQVRRGPVH
jgi:flavin-dependent thymidylate synthase